MYKLPREKSLESPKMHRCKSSKFSTKNLHEKSVTLTGFGIAPLVLKKKKKEKSARARWRYRSRDQIGNLSALKRNISLGRSVYFVPSNAATTRRKFYKPLKPSQSVNHSEQSSTLRTTSEVGHGCN